LLLKKLDSTYWHKPCDRRELFVKTTCLAEKMHIFLRLMTFFSRHSNYTGYHQPHTSNPNNPNRKMNLCKSGILPRSSLSSAAFTREPTGRDSCVLHLAAIQKQHGTAMAG